MQNPQYTEAEENYIKNIFSLSDNGKKGVQISLLTKKMGLRSASVTHMLKKLNGSALITYTPYQKIFLTKKGEDLALLLLRKHRLWESFLHEKLKFDWHEVHEIAEQLEHIKSPKLTEKLALFLGNPLFDPHGDPIPDEDGKMTGDEKLIQLSKVKCGEKVRLARILEESDDLYKLLEKNNLKLGVIMTLKTLNSFDHSLEISLSENETIFLSSKAALALGVVVL